MSRSLFGKLQRRFGPRISGNDLRESMAANAEALEAGDQESRLELSEDGKPGQTVAVIGAGFGGLSAAHFLSREGFKVTVFEARDDIGGRVSSLKNFIPNRIVEGGAELIGSNHPLWILLAQRFGLALTVLTGEAEYSGARLTMHVRVGGHDFRKPGSRRKLFNEMEAAYATLNKHAGMIPDARSPWWSCAKASQWDQQNVDAWIQGLTCQQSTKDVLAYELENDQTVPVTEQSYLGLLAPVRGGDRRKTLAKLSEPSRYWTQTEVFRCAHGNQELASKLRFRCEALSAKFYLNSPVIEIDVTRVTPIFVRSRNHQLEQFDWVVIAVPPNLLTNSPNVPKTVFVNGLNITQAQIRSGNAAKYLSRVRTRFWIEKARCPSGNDEAFGAYWEGTDNQTAGIDASGNPLEFDLSVFSGGSHAAKIMTPTSPLANEIEKVFGGYSANLAAPSKLEDWPNKDWTKTGYSCPAVGEVTTKGRFLNKIHGRTLFAGEHTSMAFFGYMEGALQSGLRVASQIAGHKLKPVP
jgi:monoamine oxidase